MRRVKKSGRAHPARRPLSAAFHSTGLARTLEGGTRRDTSIRSLAISGAEGLEDYRKET